MRSGKARWVVEKVYIYGSHNVNALSLVSKSGTFEYCNFIYLSFLPLRRCNRKLRRDKTNGGQGVLSTRDVGFCDIHHQPTTLQSMGKVGQQTTVCFLWERIVSLHFMEHMYHSQDNLHFSLRLPFCEILCPQYVIPVCWHEFRVV